jgi:hypothetical protein
VPEVWFGVAGDVRCSPRCRSYAVLGGVVVIFVATESTKPDYPCDVCGLDVEAGERVSVTDNGLTVEHTACAADWLARNYGREGL